MSETRETANAGMQQAIPHLAGDIASVRAEEDILFTKMLHCVQHFCEKIKTYHAAAGESGFHLVKHPV